MTIDKTKFQAILDQVVVVQNATTLLGDDINVADPENTFGVAINQILGNLASVEDWANTKILEIEQEQVMNSFLAELKVVFDKYVAKIELGSSATGYGEAYGEGETAVGIKLTATLEGVTATKEINKSVIISEDLV